MSYYVVRARLSWVIEAESLEAAQQWATYEVARLAERGAVDRGDPYGTVTVLDRASWEVQVATDPPPREPCP